MALDFVQLVPDHFLETHALAKLRYLIHELLESLDAFGIDGFDELQVEDDDVSVTGQVARIHLDLTVLIFVTERDSDLAHRFFLPHEDDRHGRGLLRLVRQANVGKTAEVLQLVNDASLNDHLLVEELIVQVLDRQLALLTLVELFGHASALIYSAEARARGLRPARVMPLVQVHVLLVVALRAVEAIRVILPHFVVELVSFHRVALFIVR